MSSILDVDTLLSVDVGSVNTRASLFDVVDGRYRLISTSRVGSTAGAPLLDVSEGVRMAIARLQNITGRRLLDEADTLIMPVTQDGAGIDAFVATASAGPKVRTVLVGLMPGVSVESVRRLALSTYLDVVAEIGLMDRRRDIDQINLILQTRPDLILMAGGTDGGARDSILRLVEAVSLAAGLLPGGQRPRVLFVGNRHLAASVVEKFTTTVPIALSSNVRPSLEQEDLNPGRIRLAEVIADVRSGRLSGFDELKAWAGGYLLPSADAFGRVVQYLSRVYDPAKGVLGVDLGASQATVAAAFAGDLHLSVHSDLGMGASLPGLLKYSSAEKVTRWLPVTVAESEVRDYIHNKAISPATVPSEREELYLEYAVARQVMRSALFLARAAWPPGKNARRNCRMPPLDTVIASGGTLGRAPRPGVAALALLDALQPTGVANLVLDPHCLAPALGAAAAVMPLLTVQALDTGSLVNLGTVVAPVGQGRPGQTALRVRVDREDGEVLQSQVAVGQLVVLPLALGETARVTLRPERGFDVGFGGRGKAGVLKRVAGGAVGLVIDARGRPLELARDAGRRRDLNQKWMWDIGGME